MNTFVAGVLVLAQAEELDMESICLRPEESWREIEQTYHPWADCPETHGALASAPEFV